MSRTTPFAPDLKPVPTSFYERCADVIANVTLPEGLKLEVHTTGGLKSHPDVWYLQITAPTGTDNVTGEAYHWKSRKWLLSQHMTTGEIVQTALKALLTALEHEAREQFRYKGEAIFDPHYDLDFLVALRKHERSTLHRPELVSG